MAWELEQPLIRPPSESRSVLVRLTRGCKWNLCRFCGNYPSLGEPEFSRRPVADVKRDIDRLKEIMPHARTAFIGDSDPLQAGLEDFLVVADYLRKAIPVERLTTYARASTLYKLEEGALGRLARGGLSRVHIGLESGDPATLGFHRKGQSPEMIKAVARRLKRAGIEISFYVLLGMGGRDHWARHIRRTADLINETEPEFLRLRRLWIYGNDGLHGSAECPLWEEIRDGRFVPQSPEGSVRELRLLVELLDESLKTAVVSDHQNNYVHIAGTVTEHKRDMLAEIDAFLALPPEEREAHYNSVGSGI